MNIFWNCIIFICFFGYWSTATCGSTMTSSIPTVTITELSQSIGDPNTNALSKKVQVSILNDYMNLVYGVDTPYTTGKQILPTNITLADIESAIKERTTAEKFRKIYVKIEETERKGDYTPQSAALNDHIWDPKFTPVLVFVTPDNNVPLPRRQ